MKRSATWILFFLSLMTLTVINTAAQLFSLYWLYPWLDVPAHFLGGVTVVLGFYALRGIRSYVPLGLRGFVGALLFLVVVGVLWEVFEFYVGAPREALYLLDTTTDLVMDILGGLFGYLLARALQGLEN